MFSQRTIIVVRIKIYVISVIITLCSDFQKLLIFVVVMLVVILVELLVGRSCFPKASCWDVLYNIS
jgi:hypothetical protein